MHWLNLQLMYFEELSYLRVFTRKHEKHALWEPWLPNVLKKKDAPFSGTSFCYAALACASSAFLRSARVIITMFFFIALLLFCYLSVSSMIIGSTNSIVTSNTARRIAIISMSVLLGGLHEQYLS